MDQQHRYSEGRDSAVLSGVSRRDFLRKTAVTTGLLAAAGPFVRIARAGEPGANDKIRVGLIGAGGQGLHDLEVFLGNPEVECAVVCDIDPAHSASALKTCVSKGRKEPVIERDFRRALECKDVDAFIVATPDHWHALPAVMACQAGKDVYVEKPLAKTIDEGRAIATAAKKYGRIVQMGSQWRSCNHIVEAAELVKSGKLGKVSMVRAWAWLDWQPSMDRPADEKPPEGVDYNMWLGPSPLRPFNKNRFHYNFRWFWDYAGGLMTDWGVHLLNMALMGMGQENPRTICSSGGIYVQDDMRETPDSQLAIYEFPSFMMVWEHKSGMGMGLNGRSWGVSWSGTEGTIFLNDQGYEVATEKRPGNLDNVHVKPSGSPSAQHIRNFLDCVVSRQQPVLNADAGHRVSAIAHLGNIAYRSGQKITWDSERERIAGHKAADKLVGTPYRRPWRLPFAKRA